LAAIFKFCFYEVTIQLSSLFKELTFRYHLLSSHNCDNRVRRGQGGDQGLNLFLTTIN
jgi:hypothetical protein